MTIKIHKTLEQGTDEWLQTRCGLLTASEMKNVITPKLKVANNDKTRSHLYEILAQRITNYIEPMYIGDDMLRGHVDEILARDLYRERIAPVTEVGFITNDKWGFKIGYSPDGLVGDDGLIEIKSRRQKFQIQTIIDGTMPDDYLMQCQTALLVTERKWIDYISYSGGLHMPVIRIYPDPVIQEAITEAAIAFEAKLLDLKASYDANIKGMILTERQETNEGDIEL